MVTKAILFLTTAVKSFYCFRNQNLQNAPISFNKHVCVFQFRKLDFKYFMTKVFIETSNDMLYRSTNIIRNESRSLK